MNRQTDEFERQEVKPMRTRLTKSNHEPVAAQPPSQDKQIEGRFRLQVDRQTKSTYATLEAAEAAGMAIKKSHPLVHVGIHDGLESVNKVIQLPEG
jgi:hypothetical protein